MFLRRLKFKKFRKLSFIYYLFWKNYLYRVVRFDDDYTFYFLPTTPARQIHFNIYNILAQTSTHISSGTLLKPHFIQYHCMKKNFINMQRIVYLLWLFLEDIRLEPFYFYMKYFNALTYQLLTQLRVIFNELTITFIVSKPYNLLLKKRKRIKKKTWKMLSQQT